MERIRRSEVDSVDEVVKTMNRVIDNSNRIEGLLLEFIASSKEYNKKVDKYNKSIGFKNGGKQ